MKKLSNEIQVERIVGLLDDGHSVVLAKPTKLDLYEVEVVRVNGGLHQLIYTWVEKGNS